MLEGWFHDAKHSFLIRDPNKAILSQYRASENPAIHSFGWDYFEPDEAGYQELHEMYEYVKENLDPDPVVVNAGDLLSSPKQMMKAYCDGVGSSRSLNLGRNVRCLVFYRLSSKQTARTAHPVNHM